MKKPIPLSAINTENGVTFEDLEGFVRNWHHDRGLMEVDVNAQISALGEEFGELCHAIAKGDRAARMDAIGDMMVVLTNIAARDNATLEVCYLAAWIEIKSRTGKTTGGRFIKDEEGLE